MDTGPPIHFVIVNFWTQSTDRGRLMYKYAQISMDLIRLTSLQTGMFERKNDSKSVRTG